MFACLLCPAAAGVCFLSLALKVIQGREAISLFFECSKNSVF